MVFGDLDRVILTLPLISCGHSCEYNGCRVSGRAVVSHPCMSWALSPGCAPLLPSSPLHVSPSRHVSDGGQLSYWKLIQYSEKVATGLRLLFILLLMLSLHKPVKFEVKNKFLSCLLMKLRHLLIKKILIDSFQCLFFAQTNRLIKVKFLCGQTSGIKTNCLNALF